MSGFRTQRSGAKEDAGCPRTHACESRCGAGRWPAPSRRTAARRWRRGRGRLRSRGASWTPERNFLRRADIGVQAGTWVRFQTGHMGSQGAAQCLIPTRLVTSRSLRTGTARSTGAAARTNGDPPRPGTNRPGLRSPSLPDQDLFRHPRPSARRRPFASTPPAPRSGPPRGCWPSPRTAPALTGEGSRAPPRLSSA